MKPTPVMCSYRYGGEKPCDHLATYRSPTVARCADHSGHHDFTERWDGAQWIAHAEETWGFRRAES